MTCCCYQNCVSCLYVYKQPCSPSKASVSFSSFLDPHFPLKMFPKSIAFTLAFVAFGLVLALGAPNAPENDNVSYDVDSEGNVAITILMDEAEEGSVAEGDEAQDRFFLL